MKKDLVIELTNLVREWRKMDLVQGHLLGKRTPIYDRILDILEEDLKETE